MITEEYSKKIVLDPEDITKLRKVLNSQILAIVSKTSPSQIQQYITQAIQNATVDKKNEGWYFCNSECYTQLQAIIDTEMNSTLYMLRILSEAQFDHREQKTLNFVSFRRRGTNPFTGLWKDDKKNIEMIWNPDPANPAPRQEGKLVLGLGPSASGKSFWGNYLTKWLNLAVWNGIENCFLVVDGGKYRELSVVYQTILESVQKTNDPKKIIGLTNLAMKGTKSWDPRLRKKSGILFDTDMIKDKIVSFLCKQNIYPNLYVPETLSTCDIGFLIPKIHLFLGVNDCEQKIQQLKDITGGSVVILNIWQHEEGGEKCPYESGYKCKGCIASGREREVTEGKKYSSSGFRTARNAAKIEDQSAASNVIVLKLHSSPNQTSILVNHSSRDSPYSTKLENLPTIISQEPSHPKIQYFHTIHDPQYLQITHKSTETVVKYLAVAAMILFFL